MRGALGDVQGRASPRAVAEYQAITSPRMRVRHFNIAGVAWSNFKPGINTNGRTAISNDSLSIDVVNVSEGRARVQLRAGGPSGASAVLKVDERLCEDAIKRGLGVRASRLHDDVAQGPLLRLQRPVAAEAGVDVNNQTMAVPLRGAALQAIVRQSRGKRRRRIGCANQPATDQLLART